MSMTSLCVLWYNKHIAIPICFPSTTCMLAVSTLKFRYFTLFLLIISILSVTACMQMCLRGGQETEWRGLTLESTYLQSTGNIIF